jgi:hypothetical protein
MSNQSQALEDIVAASDGVARASSGEEFPLDIRIERPVKEEAADIPWRCAVQVRLGNQIIQQGILSGTDSLEAITNAIVVAAATVAGLRRHYDVTFYGHHDFPAETFLNFAHGNR